MAFNQLFCSLILLVIFTSINLLNIKHFAKFQIIIIVIKITVFIITCYILIKYTLSVIDNLSYNLPHTYFSSSFIHNFNHAFICISVMFLGVDIASVVGGESKNPESSIPIGTNSVFIFILFYLFISVLTYLYLVLTYNNYIINLSKLFANIQYQHYFIIDILFLTSSLAAINISIYTASRLLFSQAQNQFAHIKLANVSNNGVPKNAVLIIASTILILLIIVPQFAAIGTIVQIALSIIALVIILNWLIILFSYLNYHNNICQVNSRIKTNKLPINPLYFYIALLTIITTTIILISLLIDDSIRIALAILLISGIIIYLIHFIINFKNFKH